MPSAGCAASRSGRSRASRGQSPRARSASEAAKGRSMADMMGCWRRTTAVRSVLQAAEAGSWAAGTVQHVKGTDAQKSDPYAAMGLGVVSLLSRAEGGEGGGGFEGGGEGEEGMASRKRWRLLMAALQQRWSPRVSPSSFPRTRGRPEYTSRARRKASSRRFSLSYVFARLKSASKAAEVRQAGGAA